MSDRPLNFVLNLCDGQVKFLEEIKLQKNREINFAHQMFLGLVEMTFGLVNTSFSLPQWQDLKMTFFAPEQVVKPFLGENTSFFR